MVPVELPDKTFIATMVLSTRYRPLLVWIGVGAAFGVQTLIAVTAGGLLSQLPRTPVAAAAGALFLIGAVILWRASRQEEDDDETDVGASARPGLTGLRVVGTSFAVLFLAEWGDLSQLLTAGLVVQFESPVSVFVGAWAALLLVSGLGAIVGRALLRRVRPRVVQRVGAGICLLLAVLVVLDLAGVPMPI
jgi:putative Ca2+/H+ antiporter (TMEM165/GDT1 family)